MVSKKSEALAQRARQLYESELRSDLEATQFGRHVCIEPESKKYFLGDAFDQAVDEALAEFPDRLTYTLRIGHDVTLHLGVMSR